MDVVAILARRFPGRVWSYTDEPGRPWSERFTLLDDGPAITETEVTALWPEVAAELAEEAQLDALKQEGRRIGDRLARLFHGQPLSLRRQYADQFVRVKGYLDNGDLEAAQAEIEDAEPEPGQEAIKAAMLAEFG